jgi:hypothetical protein
MQCSLFGDVSSDPAPFRSCVAEVTAPLPTRLFVLRPRENPISHFPCFLVNSWKRGYQLNPMRPLMPLMSPQSSSRMSCPAPNLTLAGSSTLFIVRVFDKVYDRSFCPALQSNPFVRSQGAYPRSGSGNLRRGHCTPTTQHHPFSSQPPPKLSVVRVSRGSVLDRGFRTIRVSVNPTPTRKLSQPRTHLRPSRAYTHALR